MSDGRYLVVLPGVTDLSSPDIGLSETHASVRDVDQFAYPSSRSASVAGNRYAQMVAEALAIRGVPIGSDLVIVGHSYGADTALDLAADRDFNGAGGYHVTHVVAAAYHSQPQLDHVPDSTEVLVLQNHRDVAVIVESVGAAHVTEAFEARRSAARRSARREHPGRDHQRQPSALPRHRRRHRRRSTTRSTTPTTWPTSRSGRARTTCSG